MRSDGRSAYSAVAPCRLVDTRDPAARFGSVDASTIRVQVTGRCGVDAMTTAVAVSITVTNTTGDGYAVVTPAATPGPTSTINWASGETRAASTVVAISQSGALDVHVSTGLDAADVIVDVTGAWAFVTGPVRGGRLVSFPGRRVLDTRAAAHSLAAGESITVDRRVTRDPGFCGRCRRHADDDRCEWARVLDRVSSGTAPPLASNVNNDRAGQDRAAGIIVALGIDGLSLYAGAASTDIVLDVTGYITGDTERVEH